MIIIGDANRQPVNWKTEFSASIHHPRRAYAIVIVTLPSQSQTLRPFAQRLKADRPMDDESGPSANAPKL